MKIDDILKKNRQRGDERRRMNRLEDLLRDIGLSLIGFFTFGIMYYLFVY